MLQLEVNTHESGLVMLDSHVQCQLHLSSKVWVTVSVVISEPLRLTAARLAFSLRSYYTRQFFLQLFVARQVTRKISRVTSQFCNLQRQQNVALRVARKVEISCVWHVHRNLQGNFVKIRQSEPVFCSQKISSWQRKSCKQFPPGALQVAKKYCERVTHPLQLAMFCSRHRCETSCKKNCLV